MTAPRRWLDVSQVCLALVISVAGTVSLSEATDHTVAIDLSRPTVVEAPFEIVPVGEKGERGLYLRPRAGRGWKGEAGGAATYPCYAPADGTYYVWILCRWRNACSNAVYLQVDADRRVILGNDPVYDEWHWVRSCSIAIKRGMHTIRLSNHSDGVALRELVLTTRRDESPDALAPVWRDLYWEGFDGCGDGTFSLWEQDCGTWEVRPKEPGPGGSDRAVVGRAAGKALMMLRVDEWAKVDIRVSVRMIECKADKDKVGLCFALKGPEEFLLLQWQEMPRMHAVAMQVLRCRPGAHTLLADFQVPWSEAVWHDVRIAFRDAAVAVSVDGGEATVVPVQDEISGGIGLYLSGGACASFDSISIRSAAESDRQDEPPAPSAAHAGKGRRGVAGD